MIHFCLFVGASDNGINVAVALEVLESLSRRSFPTSRPVIFLFNGAEEKGMVVSSLSTFYLNL